MSAKPSSGEVKSPLQEYGKLERLLATQQISNPEQWKKLCPDLSIDAKAAPSLSLPSLSLPSLSSDEKTRRRNKLITDGYVLVDEAFHPDLIQPVKTCIEQLHAQGIPPTFALLFDQTWDLARASQKVLSASTHSKNSFNFDLLAWYIPPGSGGFSPHRDRQPDDAASTFHADTQEAKFVTLWIALSEASTQNSCLYVIPKGKDPGYTLGDTEAADPLQRALPVKESYQHIRALPRNTGQSLLFTHRLIHWGSKCDVDSRQPPRIAISFVCSDPSYEAPLIQTTDGFSHEIIPPFSIRLLLVCSQMLIYHERYELSRVAIKKCYEYCKLHEGALQENYRRKVFLEFVKAVKEHANDVELPAPEGACGSNGVATLVVNDNVDDEDEEDAMMEEMLDAEAGGYGDFQDDYDDLEGEGGGRDSVGAEEEAWLNKDSDQEDEEESDSILFGKRALEDANSEVAKKVKQMLGG